MADSGECVWGNEPACADFIAEQHALYAPEEVSYSSAEVFGAQFTYLLVAGMWGAASIMTTFIFRS